MSASATYFVAARILAGPLRPCGSGGALQLELDALQVGADDRLLQALDQLNHAIPPWRPAAALFAPVGEEALVADRAGRDIRDPVHARRGEPRVRDCAQVQPAALGRLLRAPP